MHEGAEITVSELSCSGAEGGPPGGPRCVSAPLNITAAGLTPANHQTDPSSLSPPPRSPTTAHEAPPPPDLSLTLTSICGKGPREFSATLMGGITQSLFCLRRPLELLLPEPEKRMTGGGAGNGSFGSRLAQTLSSSFVTFKTTGGFI